MESLPTSWHNFKNVLKKSGSLACSVLALHGAAPGIASAGATAPRTKLDNSLSLRCGNLPWNARKDRQEQAMLCLINQARGKFGLPELAEASDLDQAAGLKARDVIRCGVSHNACDNPWNLYTPAQYDVYAENLAWGIGSCAATLAIYGGLMHSSTHRGVILSPHQQYVGISMQRDDGTSYWVLEFGGLGSGPLSPLPPESIEPTRCLAG